MLGHIEDQQSPHPIVGAALPHLREKQDVKAFGVTGFYFRHVFLKSGCIPVKGFPVVMTRRLSVLRRQQQNGSIKLVLMGV